MDQPVDGSHRRHRILEDLVPLAEDQIRGDDHRLFLVAFGEEGEEDLHLLARLLDVTEIVQNHGIESLQLGERGWQLQIAFRGEQLGHQLEGRREEHLQLMALDPFAPECGTKVRLPSAGQPEAEQIVATAHQFPCEQRRQLSPDFSGSFFPPAHPTSCPGAAPIP